MAPQVGSHFLEREHGGRGVLLGGAPGVRPARVVVLGAGNVGWNAAWIAQGMEAEVLLLDKNLDRLRWVDQIHKGRIMTLASNRLAVERAVADADLVIGAVLVPGGRAPVVVTDAMVRSMRPGAVIVDCAIDQGGCVEDIHETSHADPVYERHGVLHYAVGNIPAAVPHTSTYALTNATLPYAVALATRGVRDAVRGRPRARRGREHRRRAGRRTRRWPRRSGASARRSPTRCPTDARSGRAAGEARRGGRPSARRRRPAPAGRSSPVRAQVVAQHASAPRDSAMPSDLGVEVGALTGRLGEVPGVRGHVEDRDVHRHAAPASRRTAA